MALRRNTSAEVGGLAQEVVDEITWYMREHKITRADLAASLGVSAGRVSQILSGDENLTLRTLGAVIDALGARLEFTLGDAEGSSSALPDPL
ncbi:helix-turn-helix transcriptional regulator [Nonomuraea sp. NN258]|uniref:helix-turn-helix domain-containing protein n=1 Tax=Nonomuraea antri TaxID=2730852 RepID=UPI00156A4B67|nr:helix-turn-helix transcriptional regulator [Nonomuraea antri]NRQ33461.1 helix-turn-helix transcriptional regulator [Nonomuraea antri]